MTYELERHGFEEGAAESTDARSGLKIVGSRDLVFIVLVENDPQPQGPIETRPALLRVGNLDGELSVSRRLSGDGKQEERVGAVRPW